MELFGLSPTELLVIALVAVLVFGARLPQVAGEAAATVQKLRRALTDLRRESGIDQELRNARREIEQNVVRPFREVDVVGTVRREAAAVRADFHDSFTPAPQTPAPLDVEPQPAHGGASAAESSGMQADGPRPARVQTDEARAQSLEADGAREDLTPEPAERSDPRPD